MNNYNQYLSGLINSFPSYSLSKEDKKLIDKGNIAQWIFHKIIRKRFRKTNINDQTKSEIFTKISNCIKKKKPLHFIVCFGGYKHFWNPSYPEIDWAEVFNIRFMCEYFAPLITVYTPGVQLDYSSDDVIISRMDNYPKKSLDSYARSFENLLSLFSPVFPPNFKISYVRAKNQYDEKKLYKKIDHIFQKYKNRFNKMNPHQRLDHGFYRSSRNIMWDGDQNLTELSENEKKQKIEESKIIEDAYYESDFSLRGEYLTGNNHIPVVLSWGLAQDVRGSILTLGSTHGSTVDFWTGRGILEDRGNQLIRRIVSRNQYNNIKNRLVNYKTTHTFLKNLNQIEIFPGILEIGIQTNISKNPLSRILQIFH